MNRTERPPVFNVQGEPIITGPSAKPTVPVGITPKPENISPAAVEAPKPKVAKPKKRRAREPEALPVNLGVLARVEGLVFTLSCGSTNCPREIITRVDETGTAFSAALDRGWTFAEWPAGRIDAFCQHHEPAPECNPVTLAFLERR